MAGPAGPPTKAQKNCQLVLYTELDSKCDKLAKIVVRIVN